MMTRKEINAEIGQRKRRIETLKGFIHKAHIERKEETEEGFWKELHEQLDKVKELKHSRTKYVKVF